jgi:hypothetical protein
MLYFLFHTNEGKRHMKKNEIVSKIKRRKGRRESIFAGKKNETSSMC